MRLALYEPDIPQNTGAVMRLCSCFAVPLEIIEPCGFVLSDSRMKRAGMDYMQHLDLTRHRNWQEFYADTRKHGRRIILLSTKADCFYTDFSFRPGDILLGGRESVGVPDDVHADADARITIPMAAHARSLNLTQSCSIVLAEALRQTGLFPRHGRVVRS
ncbi:MAG: tRNA (cytidine(34)-2'-O)-methyltransferase [Alphaproteobacteria bacterium]|nr:MAG: tRNA (cytidine(34)-2'-O)-methyltransferase [Alphaproteobacteria bacterium]